MLEHVYRRLGRPEKHRMMHSDALPRHGNMSWSCGCSLNYIDANGVVRRPVIMQLTSCKSHSREGEEIQVSPYAAALIGNVEASPMKRNALLRTPKPRQVEQRAKRQSTANADT
jgi:hypothetical protein